MKKFLLLSFFALMMSSSHAFAALISYGGEEIVEVLKLPQNEKLQTPQGEHFDIGYIHKSVVILFMPVWNYDGQFVAITKNRDSYIPLSDTELESLLWFTNLDLPEKPYLDFWQRIGGKLAFLVLLCCLIFYSRKKEKKKASYLSPLLTDRDRLKDIIINGQGFVELEQTNVALDDDMQADGLAFIAVRNYVYSFLSVSVFDMNKVSIEQLKANNDAFFARLSPLKKAMSSKARVSFHYLYFVFEHSPSPDEIAALKALKKKKFMPSVSTIPCIIDLEKKDVMIKVGLSPSKKAIENCFQQAEDKKENRIENTGA